jgi:hypothetical protein
MTTKGMAFLFFTKHIAVLKNNQSLILVSSVIPRIKYKDFFVLTLATVNSVSFLCPFFQASCKGGSKKCHREILLYVLILRNSLAASKAPRSICVECSAQKKRGGGEVNGGKTPSHNFKICKLIFLPARPVGGITAKPWVCRKIAKELW